RSKLAYRCSEGAATRFEIGEHIEAGTGRREYEGVACMREQCGDFDCLLHRAGVRDRLEAGILCGLTDERAVLPDEHQMAGEARPESEARPRGRSSAPHHPNAPG